ncbi:hypothetical protein AtNW77_Chr3g0176901 [Arabidopsis thaliana]|jgi:hypothetical protein|uniref:AT3g18560/K24M9_5 n=4 Tax=Arabidopsis TaxID=3701 RepID=Q9LII3_ARATH|nr:uncharacterized protein AT3G18560 [Arabidopsis thaliana]KAG7625721.1 hypothetical protein ISN45_At03g019400 [Arabidopsis thaliana x Arabidopsis arenosa]KAG7631729.1 hypothetical protein ISN44_As03g019320 [Arabidopsis suecica]AAK55725.1 AT3g18560/K24M9_5 [Arabidopsis thaliana]AAL06799.1 AT3g18560/K24M9_5 [Arabidopsis thaliana]AEE76117.1 hypothetical protein AT3G18560 [Arabidopsis thaliana]|eukprot:NP_566614.1 hypothetical protein AT3G18560 [Arabidopsis thaliana]
MERSTPEHVSSAHKRISVSFLVSLMVLCARHASRVSKKLKPKKTRKQTHLEDYLESPKSNGNGSEDGRGGGRFGWSPARTFSPMRVRPKELYTTLSNKAMTMVGRKNKAYDGGPTKKTAVEMVMEEDEEEYGVWQREILMGGKCEPLDYSGVIYYDCSGHQLKQVPPRSPRASLVPERPTRSYVGSLLNPTGKEI